MMPPTTIPRVVWRRYREDMIRLHPDRGARVVSRERHELKADKLRTTLLNRKGQTVGFVLHPKVTSAGIEATTLYLTPENRTARAFREAMETLLQQSSIFTITAWSPGLNPYVAGPILRRLGFRRAHREWLDLNPMRFRADPAARDSPEIRLLRKSDEKDIVELSSRAYAHHIDSAFGPGGDVRVWAPDYVRELFANRRRPIDYHCSFVYARKGRLVGDVIVIKGDEGPHIMDLGVDPSNRGRGIGTALMHRALGALSSRRVKRVDLSVTVENPTGARWLYRRMGFRRALGPPRWPGLWINETVRRRMGLRISGE